MVEDRQEEIAVFDVSLGAGIAAYMDSAVEEVFTHMLRAVCLSTEEECTGERICASIRMEGQPAAECTVEVPVGAGDRITDALLGSEADWDEAMIEDAVGELCNMVAGGLKRRLGICRAGCVISLPRISRTTAHELRCGYRIVVRRRYLFGDDQIGVTLGME
jgi:chemotaxis protein CheX